MEVEQLQHSHTAASLAWECSVSSRSTQQGSCRTFALSMSFFSSANLLSWIRHMPAWLAEPPRSAHKDSTSCGVVAFSTRISSSVRVNVMFGSSACTGPAPRLRGLMEGRLRDWDHGGYSASGWAVSAWRRLADEEAWGHTTRRRAHRLKNLLAIWGNLQWGNSGARNPDLASTYLVELLAGSWWWGGRMRQDRREKERERNKANMKCKTHKEVKAK